MASQRKRKLSVRLDLSVPVDMDDAEAIRLVRNLVNIGFADARATLRDMPDNVEARRALAARVARVVVLPPEEES